MYRLVALLFISTVYAQIHRDGLCNFTNIDYSKSFNATGILGTWYEIERIPNSYETGECAAQNLYIVNNTYPMLNSTEVVSGKLVQRIGTVSNTDSVGVLYLNYTDVGLINLLILGTDYNDYLVLYGCQNNGTSSAVTAWKLGRNVTLSANTTAVVKTLADDAGLVNATWKEVSHNTTACKITNGGVNLQMSPLILLMIGLVLKKDF